VLRDGRRVGSRPIGEVDPESLISMMVGRTLADIYPARRRGIGAPVLSVRGLNRPRVLRTASTSMCGPGRFWAFVASPVRGAPSCCAP